MKCVIYLKNTADETTLAEKVGKLRGFAEGRGWEVVDCVIEAGKMSLAAGMSLGGADVVLFQDVEDLSEDGHPLDFLIVLGKRGKHWHIMDNPELSEVDFHGLPKVLEVVREYDRRTCVEAAKTVNVETTARTSGRPPRDGVNAEAALKLRGQGKTLKEVADAMGISMGRAHQLCDI